MRTIASVVYQCTRRCCRAFETRPRSFVDCLIAARVPRNDLLVIHRDRDYSGLGAVSVFPLVLSDRVEHTGTPSCIMDLMRFRIITHFWNTTNREKTVGTGRR